MHVSVAASLFVGAGRTMQVRNKFFQIRDQEGKAFRFRPQREQLLFEIQIEAQGSGEVERQQRRGSGGEILLRARDGQQFSVQLNRTVRVFLRRHAGFVVDHLNFRLQKRTLLIHSQEFETPPAFGDEVEAPIGVLFYDGDDFGHASHFRQNLLDRADDAKLSILRPAFANHLFVARLKNVQLERSAGEQYDIQRKQGNEGGQAVSVGAGIRTKNE